MATELLEPGVSVIQEFRSVSPTIVTPTLVPCVVAPCFQVVEALETDSTGNSVLNTDAVASVPAIQTAVNPGPYSGLDGLTLKVSINGGAAQTFTFSDPTAADLSAGQVKDAMAASVPAPVSFGAFVTTKGASDYLQLKSTASGDGQTLQILDGTANSVLGFADNYIVEGESKYNQDTIHVEQANFPDERGIIDELDVDEDSIRVFVNPGTSLREFQRDEAFLRRQKSAIYTSAAITFPTTTLFSGPNPLKFAFVDKKGDATEEFTFTGEAATAVALATAMNALIGATVDRVTPNADPTKIDFTSPDGYFEVKTPSADSAHAALGWAVGTESLFSRGAFTVEAADDGDGDLKTPLIDVDADDFTQAATSALVTGSVAIVAEVAIHNKTLKVALDGQRRQEIVFDGGPIISGAIFVVGNTLDTETFDLEVNGILKTVTFAGSDPLTHDDVIAQINAAAGTTVAYRSDIAGAAAPAGTYISFQVGGATPIAGASVKLVYATSDPLAWTDLGLTGVIDIEQTLTLAEIETQVDATMGVGFSDDATVATKLTLNSLILGNESKIEIFDGTANALLGFTDDSTVYGGPFPPKVGYDVYGDGVFIGSIAAVTPGAVNTRLKLDREVATTYWAKAMYIQAKNIAIPQLANEPTPDLVVDLAGAIDLKADFLRDTEGIPTLANGELIIAYKALRLDVTALAEEPSLITLEDTIDLTAALSPIDTDNPLGLMLYFALINAPGIEVAGLGVDSTSAAEPGGTSLAYSRALTFLEAQEVYAMAPGSQSPTVHQLFITHVDAQSEPDAKGERIVFINPEMPGEGIPALAVSGTDGDSTATTNEFDTKLASLAADVLAAGVDPIGSIDVADGLFLDIASDAVRYNISAITGTKVTIRVAFSPGENDDDFYSETNLPLTLISETFSIKVRGADLVTTDGDPDYSAIAEAYQDLGGSYLNRRVIMVAPEEVGAIVGSLEQKIPGYYLCAAIAGMVGQLPPQQPFTNFPISGFTRVFGSNDVFSRTQMNVGAAGGTYWVVQNVAGGPLSCRHQLTTNLNSIEQRELSITKVVDFTAKFMRSGLRNFIGKFNITQPFLDTLSTVIQGQLSFLTESGVLIGGDLNNIIQDESAPDTVLIDVTLDVPFPANYIRLTLII